MSIVFDQLTFAYFEDGKDIFQNFSASFDASSMSVLTGVSGCGKSTLLYLAAGLYPHNGGCLRSGKVMIDGQDVASLPSKERCRLVSMMFQNPSLQFCMDTVRNELIFCAENLCMEESDVESSIAAALDFCDIAHLEHRTLNSLSGGEKQKVMLACLSLIQPKWLLLDEPFANIDNESAKEIARKLKQMHEMYGTGILAVDHRLNYWLDVAERLYILRDGKILPEILSISALDSSRLVSEGIIAPHTSYAPNLPPASEGEIALQLQDVSVSYGTHEVLHRINASFRRGTIYALLGQSGCGKTTLFHALSGVTSFDGTILLGGVNLKKNRRKLAGKMGFVTQDPQDQFIGGTVSQEVSMGLSKDVDSTTEEILRHIKLWRYRDISPYMLSQGQQRRLGTAALMAYDCQVLVCDEPTYAQDRTNTMAIMEELCKAARERNIALIFSTHDHQLAQDYADHILVMDGGYLHEKD